VAIATPPGRGGLGVVRLSGPVSVSVAQTLLGRPRDLKPRHATLCRISGLDDVVATYFPAPSSYTGEDVVEISAHGSPVVLEALLGSALAAGARLAAPGEFTLRAFLHGRLDLIQAEAVADLIDAATPLQARAAFDQLEGTLTRRIGEIDARLFDVVARLEASLDFPDEGYHFIQPQELAPALRAISEEIEGLGSEARRGQLIREGATVVIVGRVNAGKSSVFNRLVGAERAIVADRPGTTRDLVTERVDVGGLSITFADSAGFRSSEDQVEREGVERSQGALRVAAAAIVVLDGSEPLEEHDHGVLNLTVGQVRVVVANKADLEPAWADSSVGAAPPLRVSARTGEGFDELRRILGRSLGQGEAARDTAAISNVRHARLLEAAGESLSAAEAAVQGGAPEECVVSDLRGAQRALEEVTGRRTSDDLLRHIFGRFCIGK
jgi:tRNA modification GTPase